MSARQRRRPPLVAAASRRSRSSCCRSPTSWSARPGGGDALGRSWRERTLELRRRAPGCSSPAVVGGGDRRSACRSRGSSCAPTSRAGALGRGGRAAARDPELRRRAVPARRVRPARAAAGGCSRAVRRRAAARRSTASPARSLALTLSTYPYVFLLVTAAALATLDPALEEAARGLGQSRWRSSGGDASGAAPRRSRRRPARRALRSPTSAPSR